MTVSFIFRIHCTHLTRGLQKADGLTSSGQGVKPKSSMMFRSMGTRSNTTTAANEKKENMSLLLVTTSDKYLLKKIPG
jgi:hypothetical protein